MIFIDNKYTRWYYAIVQRAQHRASTKKQATNLLGYVERHHIIPECFFIDRKRKGTKGWLPGDPDSTDNLVFLTAREHFICHQLLVRMTINEGKFKMIAALNKLTFTKHHYKIVGWQYNYVRKNWSEIRKNRKRPIDAIEKSMETKRINGTTSAGNSPSARLKAKETRKKNGHSYWPAEAITKAQETKRKNGTLNTNTPDSIAKGLETKRKNGKLNTTTPENRKQALETYNETLKKRELLYGKMCWWTNGNEEILAFKCPDNWYKGRVALPDQIKENISKSKKGYIYWNDGFSNTTSRECPGPNFVKGKLKITNTTKKI